MRKNKKIPEARASRPKARTSASRRRPKTANVLRVGGLGIPIKSDRFFLTTEQAAEHMNVGVSTLAKWRSLGKGPKYHRFGRSIRYSRANLDAFAESQRRGSTSEEPPATNKKKRHRVKLPDEPREKPRRRRVRL